MKLHLSVTDWIVFSLLIAMTIVLYLTEIVPDSVVLAFVALGVIFLLSSGYPLETATDLENDTNSAQP